MPAARTERRAPEAGWNPAWHALSPLYRPLLEAAQTLGLFRPDWPGLDDYNCLLQSAPVPILTHSGKPVHCVAQADDPYELRAYLSGEVQTRSENWHDLFNALVWYAFPRAKSAINLLHYRASLQQQGAQRGTARDVLTLFDESGVVVACDRDDLAELLTNHQWKSLFWQQRAELPSHMEFFVFGHSLYEKALQPYIGMTGKTLVVPVAPGFFALPPTQQLTELDAMLERHFLDAAALHSTASLGALPLLGVPGWWPDNESETFYENTAYFRPAPDQRKNPTTASK
jgi:hypothetical protein